VCSTTSRSTTNLAYMTLLIVRNLTCMRMLIESNLAFSYGKLLVMANLHLSSITCPTVSIMQLPGTSMAFMSQLHTMINIVTHHSCHIVQHIIVDVPQCDVNYDVLPNMFSDVAEGKQQSAYGQHNCQIVTNTKTSA
jgi:hypothetical protein